MAGGLPAEGPRTEDRCRKAAGTDGMIVCGCSTRYVRGGYKCTIGFG